MPPKEGKGRAVANRSQNLRPGSRGSKLGRGPKDVGLLISTPREPPAQPPVSEWGKTLKTAREQLEAGEFAAAQDTVDRAFQQFVVQCGLHEATAGAIDDMPFIRDAEVWLREVFQPKFKQNPLVLQALASIYACRGSCMLEHGWYGRAALEYGMAAELVGAADDAGGAVVRRAPRARRRLGPTIVKSEQAKAEQDDEALRKREEEDLAWLGTLKHLGPTPAAVELEELEAKCEDMYTSQLRCLSVGSVPGSATGIDKPTRVLLDRGSWRDKKLADATRPTRFRRGTVISNPTDGCAIAQLPRAVLEPETAEPASPRLTDSPPPDKRVSREPFDRKMVNPGKAVIECGRKVHTSRRNSKWNFDDSTIKFAELTAPVYKYEGETYAQRLRRSRYRRGGWCGETPTHGV